MKRWLAAKRLFGLVSALSLAACLDTTAPPPGSDPLTETFAASLGIGNLRDTTVWKVTALGTFYRDDSIGTGAQFGVPIATDSVFADFTGWLKDGTIFQPAVQNVGEPVNGVILGFLDGLVGMRIGGIRTVVIPSDLGFGNSPQPGSPIPANATLVFKLKLDSFTGAP